MNIPERLKGYVVGQFTTESDPQHYYDIMDAQDFDDIPHIYVWEAVEHMSLADLQENMENSLQSLTELIEDITFHIEHRS